MKNQIYLLLVLFAANSYSQQWTAAYNDYERVYVEAGMLIPLDGLKDKIEPSVDFGFWYRTKFTPSESYDIGFNFYVPKSRQTFDYEVDDSIYRNRARSFSGMVGARYCKSIALSAKNKKINFEVFPSLGYAFFMYKKTFLYDADFQNEDGKHEHNSRALSTFHLGTGVRLNINNVALQVQYQYTPYSLFYEYLDKDFGSQSLTFGIVYRQ